MVIELPKCDVLLVTVTDVETEELERVLTTKTRKQPSSCFGEDLTYRDHGDVGGARVLHVRCRMGSDSPGGSTTTIVRAIHETRPRSIIMVGIAFGTKPDAQKIGTTLVAERLQGYDLQRVGTDRDSGAIQVTPRGDCVTASTRLLDRLIHAKESYKNRNSVQFGTVLSGQKLIDNLEYRTRLEVLFPEAIGGEMEGQGLYAAAKDKSEWILVKAVCDWADGNKSEDKSRRQKRAAKAAADFVVHALALGGFESPEGGRPHGVAPTPQDDDEPILEEHRARLVRELAYVSVLRDIADNDDGRGQNDIRLEDVFVCPSLEPDEHLLERDERARKRLARDQRTEAETEQRDRRDLARAIEYGQWRPHRLHPASTVKVSHVLGKYRRVLIVGAPGAGKSTLLSALILATVSERLSAELSSGTGGLYLHGRFPLHLRLAEATKDDGGGRMELSAALAKSLGASVRAASEGVVDRLLRSGRALLVLDGLDEVPTVHDRKAVADALGRLASAYRDCPIIVSTRPGGRILLPGFEPFVLPPMTPRGKVAFVSSWSKALGLETPSRPLKPERLEEIGEISGNPLMLVIMLLRGSLELAGSERVLFYDQALRTMLTTLRASPRHDLEPIERAAWRAWGEVAHGLCTDGSGAVVPRANLERRLWKALEAECADGDPEVLASRLVDAALQRTGLVIKRGGELTFWHSTFGEYLAATALARDDTFERLLRLRSDRRNVEIAVMLIDHLVHVQGEEGRASACLRALFEQRDVLDDLRVRQLGFSASCIMHGCYARPEDIDRCLLVILRLCRELPHGGVVRELFSNLANSRPNHVPGEELTSELARVVTEHEPPVDPDVAMPMLAMAGRSHSTALTVCQAMLDRSEGPAIRRAFAALGLARGGRLGATNLPALVELSWFSDPGHGRHGHEEDALEPRAASNSFVGRLCQALGQDERRALCRWSSSATEPKQGVAIMLLRALTLETNDPDESLVNGLLDIATTAGPDAARENARGLLGRLAARHPRLRSVLLPVALSPEADLASTERKRRDSEAANWAQSLLVRLISLDPHAPMWLVDEVARAAFSSLVERREDQAVQFLRYILHAVADAHSTLDRTILRRRHEVVLWPHLAAFVLSLSSRQEMTEIREPLWLACVRSENPWYVLRAFDCWTPDGWSRHVLPDEGVDAFVDACVALLEIEPDATLPEDVALAPLSSNGHGLHDRRNAGSRARSSLGRVLSRPGPLARRAAERMRYHVVAQRPASAVLAVLLAENGGVDGHPGLIEVLENAALRAQEVEVRARAAYWLAKHGPASSRPPADELQWSMLRGATGHKRYDYADVIFDLAPPSDPLLHRMVGSGVQAHLLEYRSNWIFSSPNALSLLIGYLHEEAPYMQQVTACNLLRVDAQDLKITHRLFACAREAAPETCFWLAEVIEARLASTSPAGQGPSIEQLWRHALASTRPSTVLAAFERMTSWSGRDEAVTKAIRVCLRADDPMTRFYMVMALLRWSSNEPLGTALSKATSILDVSEGEIIESLEECLEYTDVHIQLFASAFLTGFRVALDRCEQALGQLTRPGNADRMIELSFCPYVGQSMGQVMARGAAGAVFNAHEVFDSALPEKAPVRDVAEILLWIHFGSPIPHCVELMLASLGTPPAREDALSWRQRPARAAVSLARSPEPRLREPALRAIAEAIGAERRSWPVYHHAIALLEVPDLLETVMEWSLAIVEKHGLRQVALALAHGAKEQPEVYRAIVNWLRLAATATGAGADIHRAERAIGLLLHLGVDDDVVCQSVLVASAKRYRGLREAHVHHLESHWRELPLPPQDLLRLMISIGQDETDPCPEARAEIIAHFLQAEDPGVRLDALDAWSHEHEPRRNRALALQAWRSLLAEDRLPCADGACALALELFVAEDAETDLVEFLRECVEARSISTYYRLDVLSAMVHIPSERAWVESAGLALLESVDERELGSVVDWHLKRWRPHPENLPLAVARAAVKLVPSGWIPNPPLSKDDRSLFGRGIPLIDTPFDAVFARVFAEILDEAPASLRALFEAARRHPQDLETRDRERIMDVVRMQPGDHPTRKLARRWWHHQLGSSTTLSAPIAP